MDFIVCNRSPPSMQEIIAEASLKDVSSPAFVSDQLSYVLVFIVLFH